MHINVGRAALMVMLAFSLAGILFGLYALNGIRDASDTRAKILFENCAINREVRINVMTRERDAAIMFASQGSNPAIVAYYQSVLPDIRRDLASQKAIVCTKYLK